MKQFNKAGQHNLSHHYLVSRIHQIAENTAQIIDNRRGNWFPYLTISYLYKSFFNRISAITRYMAPKKKLQNALSTGIDCDHWDMSIQTSVGKLILQPATSFQIHVQLN